MEIWVEGMNNSRVSRTENVLADWMERNGQVRSVWYGGTVGGQVTQKPLNLRLKQRREKRDGGYAGAA